MTAATASNPPSEMSAVQRIMNVFFAPRQAFASLRNAGWFSWLPPLLVMCVFGYIMVFAAAQKVGWEQLSENQMKANPSAEERMAQLTPEQRAQQMSMTTNITKGVSYAWPVMVIITLAIYSAILLGVFNFGMGAEFSYKVLLALTMYAELPTILRSLLATISLYAGADPEGFMFQNPVASNPAFLVSMAEHPFLYNILMSLDIFGLWVVVLVGIGISALSKIKTGTAIAIVAGLYFLRVILFSLPALFF